MATAVANQIWELVTELRLAANAYYNSTPIMSDAEFDKKRDQLEKLDPDNPFLSEVGAPIDNALEEVEHVIPMGSLKKVNENSEFETWLKSVGKVTGKDPECAVQQKADGSSIELVYENKRFKQAITRGDGKKGLDVTHSIKNAHGVPKTISEPGTVYVRGEAIMSISTWEKNKHHGEGWKNPRNTASGIVQREDGKHSELLDFLAFDVRSMEKDFKTILHKINWLTKHGFKTVDTKIIPASEVQQFVADLEEERKTLDYQIDGVVVKINSVEDQEKLGEHKGYPYWAIAWKFEAEVGHSNLLSVVWQIGTKGTINPVAIIEPVDICGVTIKRASLHNMDEIARLGIKIGDRIEVMRANDVIPKISAVIKPGAKRKDIECSECPECGASTIQKGPFLYCTNKNCTGVQFKRLMTWVKKRDIMYLGESAMEKLFQSGTVESVPDIYALDEDALVKAGLGRGEAKRLMPEIEKSKTVMLPDLIGSLSIDLLGRSEANNINDGGIRTVSQWKNLKEQDLIDMGGFQAVSAGRIVAGVKAAWPIIEKLLKVMDVTEKAAPAPKTGKLLGMTFCFTGELSQPRKNLEAMVEANGGKIASVSKKLTYLVADDPSSGSGKAKKARDLGVKIIGEDDFLKMV